MRVFYWSYQLCQKISWAGSHARHASWINVNSGRSSRLGYWCHHKLVRYQKLHFSSSMPHLSGSTQMVLPWESSLCESPMRKLEAALEENCVDDAWEVFCCYKRLHGFPKQAVVRKMISLMTRSLSSQWPLRAYQLVLLVLHKSPYLLDYDSLIRLALILARSQMPVPASTIMRIALDRFKFPSLDILSTLFFHLVKSDIGSHLASNILIEICEQYLYRKPDTKNFKQLKLLNQNVTIFNLVLNSCSKFESFQKALLIVKFMSQTGVAADANSIVIFARIYEKLGQRDELMRLKVHVDSVVSATLSYHYGRFYDSLLSLHFRCNDLDAAMELMLDLYSQSKFFQCVDGLNALANGLRKPCLLQIGSGNLTMGYKVLIEPNELGSDFIVDSTGRSTLVLFSDGKLVPSTKALAKLINGFVKERRVGEISKFLIEIEKKTNSKELSFSTFVLAACIYLGWLETAHDVLDDLESAGISVEVGLYKSLLQAYWKENLYGESKVLLNQMRKLGQFVNLSDEDAVNSFLSVDCTFKPLRRKGDFSSCLVGHLNREISEEDLVCPLVYDFNATILFFCKANMMEDAIRTVKRMQQKNIQPTIQTFSYLLNGYSSLKMYRQITMLWGEIKRRLEDGVLPVDRDLFDCLLMNFLRGGYFERVMEIVNYMRRHNMFADKWKYKEEFLKLHKDLYRNLKAALAKTDAQRKRLEQVRAFRKWVNFDML